MKICICGGGSLGIVCAGVFLEKGAEVRILSGHPKAWSDEISVADSAGRVYSGRLAAVSDRPSDVVAGADIVLLCVPGYMIEKTLADIKPYLGAGATVGSIVSSTGFFFFAHRTFGPDVTLFGFQRVPFIARVQEYGRSGHLLGYKPSVNVCVESADVSAADAFRCTLERLTGTKVNLLENFYEAALTNSNPILHTGRLYAMWGKHPVEPAVAPSLFYHDWDDEASEMLIAMDEEFQRLLDALGIRRGVIPPLLDYYESSDAPTLTAKLRSIEAFKDIKSPMKETPQGWVPDYTSRYFTEDFPFGLRFIVELAREQGVDAPVVERVYAWGMSKIR